MHIETTNWGKEVIVFHKILYVLTTYDEDHNQTFHTIKEISLLESKEKIVKFFSDVSKMQKSKQHRDSYFKNTEHYQFFLDSAEHPMFPVKWFNLILDNGVNISHDIAFDVTLIRKNKMIIPFSRFFPSEFQKRSKYHELIVKRNAYRYIANQIKNS